jgi:tetratricopeptide (TPR) repeat protein
VLRREAELAQRAGDRAEAARHLCDAFAAAARAGLERQEEELSRALRSRWKREELQRLVERRAAKEPLFAALLGDLDAEKNPTRAAAAYKRALGKTASDRYVLGQLAALEKGADRIRDLQALAKLDPSDPRLAVDLATALFDAKRDDEAIAEVRSVRARFPDNAVVLFDFGDLLSRRKRDAEALELYERVVQLDGARPEYEVALGDTYRALGRRADAVAAYWRLLGPSPTRAGYQRLAKLLDDRGEKDEVARVYKKALEQSPDDVPLRRELAEWLERAGRLDESKAEWQRIGDATKDPFVKKQAAHAVEKIERKKMFNK